MPIWAFVSLYGVVSIYRAIAGDLFKTTRITGIAAVSIGLGIWLTGNAITTDADTAPAA